VTKPALKEWIVKFFRIAARNFHLSNLTCACLADNGSSGRLPGIGEKSDVVFFPHEKTINDMAKCAFSNENRHEVYPIVWI